MAPIAFAFGCPFSKRIMFGIDWIPYRSASYWFSSMFTFTSLRLRSSAIRSSTGDTA